MTPARRGPILAFLLLLCAIVAGLPTCPAVLAADAPAADDPVAQGHEAFKSGGRYPWYDAEADTLKPLTLVPPRPPNPMWKYLGKILRWAAWITLGLLLVAIGVMLFLAVRARQARTNTNAKPAASPAARIDQVEALPFLQDRARDDLLGEARRHYEAGNYGEAIIYLFSYQLIALDRSSLIHLTKGKTNRQYLREAGRRPPLARLLERSMVTFEGVFFGGHALDRATFEACWGQLPEFDALLAQEAT